MMLAGLVGGCRSQSAATATPAADSIDEARARGVARQNVGDPCREGVVEAQRREHAGRAMWRVTCEVPVSRQSNEIHVIWIDAVSGEVDTRRSEFRARQAELVEAKIDEQTAIEHAKQKLGVRCLRSTWEVDPVERGGEPWWDVKCTATGDEAQHMASAMVNAVTGHVEVDQFELEAHGSRPNHKRRDTEPRADPVDQQRAIAIARRAIGEGSLSCAAELQSFDSGRRWSVECALEPREGRPDEQTVWVDATTGDAELVRSGDGTF